MDQPQLTERTLTVGSGPVLFDGDIRVTCTAIINDGGVVRAYLRIVDFNAAISARSDVRVAVGESIGVGGTTWTLRTASGAGCGLSGAGWITLTSA